MILVCSPQKKETYSKITTRKQETAFKVEK